jgi:hypothetical protein
VGLSKGWIWALIEVLQVRRIRINVRKPGLVAFHDTDQTIGIIAPYKESRHKNKDRIPHDAARFYIFKLS